MATPAMYARPAYQAHGGVDDVMAALRRGKTVWSPGYSADLGRMTAPLRTLQRKAVGEEFTSKLEDAADRGEGIMTWGPDEDGRVRPMHHFMQEMKRFHDQILAKYPTDAGGEGLTLEGLEAAIESGGAATLPFVLQPGWKNVVQIMPRVVADLPHIMHSYKTAEWDTKTASPAASWAWDGAAKTETPNIPLHADTLVGQKVSMSGLITGTSLSDFANKVAHPGLQQFLIQGRRVEIDIALEIAILRGDGTLGTFKGGRNLWDAFGVNKATAAVDRLDVEALQDLFLVNNPDGAASPNYGVTDPTTWRKIAAFRDAHVTQAWGDPQGLNPEGGCVVSGIEFRPNIRMPTTPGARQVHVLTRPSLAIAEVIPATLAEYGPLTTARVWAYQWWGVLVDFSAADANNKDGTGGVSNASIYAVA